MIQLVFLSHYRK